MVEIVDRTSSPAHIGKLRNVIDFLVTENTPVLAATNGIVTYVKDDSNIGGPNPSLLELHKLYSYHACEWRIF